MKSAMMTARCSNTNATPTPSAVARTPCTHFQKFPKLFQTLAFPSFHFSCAIYYCSLESLLHALPHLSCLYQKGASLTYFDLREHNLVLFFSSSS